MKSLVLNRKQLPSGETLECKVAFNQSDELLIYDIIMPQKTYDGERTEPLGVSSQQHRRYLHHQNFYEG
jgi:hypothetical protein